MQLDQNRWAQVWRRAVPAAIGAGPFEELRCRYDEPARHYHGAGHIGACLENFDSVKALVVDPLAVELAIWFHDAIYDSRATDNEDRSARFAMNAIAQAGGRSELAQRVGALVIATKTHEAGSEPDAPWLIDIDLAILGQPAAVFDAYECAVRAEYVWVEPVEYCRRRALVMAAFLARRAVYCTPCFRARFEVRARANLRRSIQQLRRGELPR